MSVNNNLLAKTTKKKKQKQSMAPNLAPVTESGTLVRSKPYNFTSADNKIVVRHREYLGTVTSGGTSALGLAYYPLNPGDHTVFPWLSGIARSFTRFRFRKAEVTYITEAPTTLGGCVLMAYSPDGARMSNIPATKSDLLEYASAARCAPWENSNMACAISSKEQFVLPGNCYAPGNGSSSIYTALNAPVMDVREVTDGIIFTATSGVPAGIIGDLYLDYEVELSEPCSVIPMAMGNCYCVTSAGKIFVPAMTVNPNSQVNFLMADNVLNWNLNGQCLLTVYLHGTVGLSALLTWTTNATVIKQTSIYGTTAANYADAVGYVLLLALNCNGLTSLTATAGAGLSSVLASTPVSVIMTPLTANSFGSNIFA